MTNNPYVFSDEIKGAFEKILDTLKFCTVLWAGKIAADVYFMIVVPGVFRKEGGSSGLLRGAKAYVGTKEGVVQFQCPFCLFKSRRDTGAVSIKGKKLGDPFNLNGKMIFFMIKDDGQSKCEVGERDGTHINDVELFKIMQT